MTPDRILRDLATAHEPPRAAMLAARERRDEMVPVFLDLLDRLRAATPETVEEADLDAVLPVVFLLGEWRDARACRPLTRLLRRDIAYLDLVLGDVLTEDAARIVAGVCDGDIAPIVEVIEDAEADDFARGAMIDALVLLARENPAARPGVEAYLARFPDRPAEGSSVVWSSWAMAVAELGLVDLAPRVRHVIEERGLVSPREMDVALFQRRLDETVGDGTASGSREAGDPGLVTDAIEEVTFWYRSEWRPGADSLFPPGSPGLYPGSVGVDTFVRDEPKVGRNDPCPCGSGRKFKKCCLS